MTDLDFGFFNILQGDRTGLVYQKYFLDRLAPIFFPPRVARLLELQDLNSRICNIVLPLGPGNLQYLDKEKKKRMLSQSRELADDFNLGLLAVDRRLKEEFALIDYGIPLIFGDQFIEALALVQTRRILSRHAVRKIIIVGSTQSFPSFLEAVCQFCLPVSIQSFCPTHFEVLTYRLLYDKGCAVSTSLFNPENWEAGDLVLAFNPAALEENRAASPAFCINLCDDSQGWAPEIELQLNKHGLEGRLHNIAPLMESTLLSKAGYFQVDEEGNSFKSLEPVELPYMEELGCQMGLWERFLDKA